MTFDEYQKAALITDSSKGKDTMDPNFFAVALGLMSEVGEVGEKLKKIYWHKAGAWNDEEKREIAKELGDVLWYLASLASHTGVPLEEIAKNNLEKLKSRVERGQLLGFGDNR